jgi:hypothetical protein
VTNTTAFPFSTNIEKYKPAASGQPASSYELNVTDNEFQFPQVWRSNIAVDRRLPGGFTGTAEFIYNRDVNGMYYINANLPAAQTTYTGVDKRARWVGTACSATGNAGGCVTRINANPGKRRDAEHRPEEPGHRTQLEPGVLGNQADVARGQLRTAYSYGEAKNTIDPGSTAGASWNSNPTPSDPNNPGLGYSNANPGHRFFASMSYTKQYFGFGATHGLWLLGNTHAGEHQLHLCR